MTIMETYDSIYGIRAKFLLRTLGGDPESIIADTAAKCAEPNPLTDILGLAPTTDAEIAEAAHHAIRRAIQTAYFSQLSRSAAAVIVDALGRSEYATISIFDDMTYNDYSFADAWAEAHPDEPRIQIIDPDCLP